MSKRVIKRFADFLLAAAALAPAYLSLHHLLVDRLKPNPGFPKMQDALGLVCMSLHTLLFLILLRLALARSFFTDRLGGYRGNFIWTVSVNGLFLGWLWVLMLGGGTDGFLD